MGYQPMRIAEHGQVARATGMLIRNLAGIFTCEGFAKRDGRRVRAA